MSWSFDKWSIDFCAKYHNQIETLVTGAIFLSFVALFGFFLKVGYQIGTKSTGNLIESIAIGVLGVVAFTICSFVYERDLKNLILPFAFSVSGVLFGICGGFFDNIFGWLLGSTIGLPIPIISALYIFRKAT